MSKKILVVDDEPSMIKAVRYILEDNGYAVIGASTGEECIERAREEAPDIILLDVLLAGSSGLTICRRLKDDDKTKNIPVILVTALLGDSIQGEGAGCGAAHVISKPYDPDDLLWIIKDTLKRITNEQASGASI